MSDPNINQYLHWPLLCFFNCEIVSCSEAVMCGVIRSPASKFLLWLFLNDSLLSEKNVSWNQTFPSHSYFGSWHLIQKQNDAKTERVWCLKMLVCTSLTTHPVPEFRYLTSHSISFGCRFEYNLCNMWLALHGTLKGPYWRGEQFRL